MKYMVRKDDTGGVLNFGSISDHLVYTVAVPEGYTLFTDPVKDNLPHLTPSMIDDELVRMETIKLQGQENMNVSN